MTRHRLTWLLLLLGALLLLRWLVPPPSISSAPEVVAVVRPQHVAPAPAAGASRETTAASREDVGAMGGVREADADAEAEVIGNAFAVRGALPVAPPPAPIALAMAAPPAPRLASGSTAVNPPPAEPPPPQPPLTVIGTWDDGSGRAVFVASPQGTTLARTGSVLLGEYRVTAINAQQIVLRALASPREFTLAVPSASGFP